MAPPSAHPAPGTARASAGVERRGRARVHRSRRELAVPAGEGRPSTARSLLHVPVDYPALAWLGLRSGASEPALPVGVAHLIPGGEEAFVSLIADEHCRCAAALRDHHRLIGLLDLVHVLLGLALEVADRDDLVHIENYRF